MENDDLKEYIKELEADNKKLKIQITNDKEFKKKISKTGYWIFKKLGLIFISSDLKENTNAIIDEFNEKKKVSKDTVVNFSVSVFKRLTRMRLITIMIALLALVSPILLFQQNKLIRRQNEKIGEQTSLFELQNKLVNQQSFLAEAARRSSKTVELGSILKDVDVELNNIANIDSTLSPRLVSKIINLSFLLKPYQYLENGEIIERPLSPERGQLLMQLIGSGINKSFLTNSILQNCDFSYSDLKNIRLYNVDLRDMNMKNSNFAGVVFDAVTFENSDFSGSYFNKSTFNGCDFSNGNLSNTIILNSKFIFNTFIFAQLSNSKVFKTSFHLSDLRAVNFSESILNNIDFVEVKFGKDKIEKKYGKKKYTLERNTIFKGAEYIDSLFVSKQNWLQYHQDNLGIEGLENLNSIKPLDQKYYFTTYKDSNLKSDSYLIGTTNKVYWTYNKESKKWEGKSIY